MVNKENVYVQIEKSGNLPTLPEVLLKLLDACDNEETPLADIAAIISKDPALCFKVLHLVNSAYYGLRTTFTSVEQAVIFLGTNRIKNVVLSTSIHQVFERKKFRASKRFKIGTFWWHSLMCATLSRRIAQKIQYSNIDEAYLSGLLCDIGRLILVSTFPKEHDSFLFEIEDIDNELWAEKQLFGTTHCEAGAWLVQKWKLNSMMADAIRYHHEPLDRVQDALPLVQIVFIANLLQRKVEGIDDLESRAGELLFGLDAEALQEIAQGSVEEVVTIADNLNIVIKPPAIAVANVPKNEAKDGDVPLSTENVVDVVLRFGEEGYDEEGGQNTLISRIKNVALLSGFLENLVHARDTETVLAVFEQAMSVLFNVSKVLFFLPDREGVLLKARVSATNHFSQLSRDLVLPIQKSASAIVASYLNESMAFLHERGPHRAIADEQIVSAFDCATLLLMPIVFNNRPGGIILLGLPKGLSSLPGNDNKLIKVLAQQVGICLVMEDMQAKKAEEVEAERIAAVSMTARKFAHEINNPLGIITNYLTMMRLKLDKDNNIQEEIGIISEEINRICSMVNQMDLLSQSVSHRKEAVDVNATIGEIVQIVKEPFFNSSKTVIAFSPDSHLPKILTSKDALKQVLINLIKNASEAMGNGGTVNISTKLLPRMTTTGGESFFDSIEILVEDNGPGMPDSVMQSLYKPYTTTKKNGHAGLGLSIVQKIVKNLGGSISCTSTTDVGTSFSIVLPAASDASRMESVEKSGSARRSP